MPWPFCNSSNSPGKSHSSSGEAVRHCEAPASSGAQALWDSWEHSQLTWAGRCHCCCSTITFVPVPPTAKPGLVCAPPPTSLHWGICWFVLREPPAATPKHRVPQRALPRSIRLLNTERERQSMGAARRTARRGQTAWLFNPIFKYHPSDWKQKKNQLEAPCFFTELGEL